VSLNPALADVLRGGRSEFNRRFELAQARYPGIEPAAFSEILSGPVDRMIGKVARVDAAAVPALVDTLYELSLMLLGQRWIGPGGRAPALLAGWELLAENAPVLLAKQPLALATSIANALVHWSSHGGGDDWLLTLSTLAQRARSPDELLRAGQIAAWRHGMAHYRESALERARALDRELLALALGVPVGDWHDRMRVRLITDRWYRPDVPSAAPPRVMCRLGAFVGFGGRFSEPPVAGLIDGELILDAGGARYTVHADAYGANVQTHPDGQRRAAQALPSGWRIEAGTLISPTQGFAFAEYGAITGAAHSADTLLLTHAWSHSATLLALV